jgi:arginase
VTKSVSVIDAPSNLGLRPPGPGREPGVRRLASALRGRGIVGRLGAEDGGTVLPSPYSPTWDGETVRNAAAIRRFSVGLADLVGPVVGGGRFPLVLGGDCSILIGNMLALRRAGRYGLVFLDGHLDFRHPGNSTSVGAAAGEDLALVTGRGQGDLTDIEGLGPLVRDEDVVALGEREGDPRTADILRTGITVWDLAAVRYLGPAEAAARAVERLRENGVEGFWVHLDADVLDDAVMPAVDSRRPGGLEPAELVEALRVLVRSGLAVGMEVTIFDPDGDPTGEIAEGLVSTLEKAFEEGSRSPGFGTGR